MHYSLQRDAYGENDEEPLSDIVRNCWVIPSLLAGAALWYWGIAVVIRLIKFGI